MSQHEWCGRLIVVVGFLGLLRRGLVDGVRLLLLLLLLLRGAAARISKGLYASSHDLFVSS